MSKTKVSRDIPLEEVQRTLSVALGRPYRVTATSDSTLKVRLIPLMTAKVNVTWEEDGTTLQAAPGEVWFLQGINALTIYPKVNGVKLSLHRCKIPAWPGEDSRS